MEGEVQQETIPSVSVPDDVSSVRRPHPAQMDPSSSLPLGQEANQHFDGANDPQSETLSSRVVGLDGDPVKWLCLALHLSLVSTSECPLKFSTPAILQLTQSLNPHVALSADHALSIVLRHGAQRCRKRMFKTQLTSAPECPRDFGTKPISMDDIFHPSILSASLADGLAPLTIPQYRRPQDLQV